MECPPPPWSAIVSAMDIDARVDAYAWSSISEHLDAHGWAMLTKLLTPSECEALAGLYVSRAEVVPLRRGDGVFFAVHNRPVLGTRGIYRVNLRHGVSRLRSGHRHTAGVIFHDAK